LLGRIVPGRRRTGNDEHKNLWITGPVEAQNHNMLCRAGSRETPRRRCVRVLDRREQEARVSQRSAGL
jgi:hypothetical protein